MNVERELRALAADLAWPETPQLSEAVAARIVAAPLRRRRLRLAVIAVAAALAALGAVLALSPGARSAFLELFRIGGAEVARVDELPDEAGWRRLDLGVLVPVAEARERAGFVARLPADVRAVFYDDRVGGGAISFVRCCEPRIVVTQFRGEAIPFVQKFAGPGTSVEPVVVEAAAGVWISGEPHAVVFRDASGDVRQEELRLAGPVLLLELDGVTYRVEGAQTLARAREAIAGLF